MPLLLDWASVWIDVESPGNLRMAAEWDVWPGGQLGMSAEAFLCGDVVRRVGEEALEQSRRNNGDAGANGAPWAS